MSNFADVSVKMRIENRFFNSANTEVTGDLSESIGGNESCLGWFKISQKRKDWALDDSSKK